MENIRYGRPDATDAEVEEAARRAALGGAALVIDERQAAVGALNDLAAGAAHDECRVAAPVQHDDDLLVSGECLADERLERPRDDVAVPQAELLTHVDTGDFRQRDGTDAVRHGEQRELARARAVVRLEGGCRAAEDEHRPLEAREGLGDDARVVARRLVLLVAHVLLLI